MVYQILISNMYLHFSNVFLVFIIVGLAGDSVVIVQDFRPLIPPLFLSPDNTTGTCLRIYSTPQHNGDQKTLDFRFAKSLPTARPTNSLLLLSPETRYSVYVSVA